MERFIDFKSWGNAKIGALREVCKTSEAKNANIRNAVNSDIERTVRQTTELSAGKMQNMSEAEKQAMRKGNVECCPKDCRDNGKYSPQ